MKLRLILIFILSFIWIFNFSIRGIDAHHDAIVFVPAFDVLNGKVLLKETFTQYGVLMTYIHAFFLKVFGVQILSLKIATTFFYSLTALLIYLASKKLMPSFFAISSVVVWILIAPYYAGTFYTWAPIYGAFFSLVVFYLFLFDKGKLNSNIIFLIGIFSAFAFWSKQTFLLIPILLVGYFLLLFILKSIDIKTLLKSIYFLGLGFILVSLVFLTTIVFSNSLQDFWLQTIRTGYTSGRIISTSFSFITVLKLFVSHPVMVVFPISIIFFFISGFKKLKENSKSVSGKFYLGMSAIALASILRTYPVPDINHYYWAITPFFLLAFYFLYLLYKSKVYKKIGRIIIFAFIVLLLFEVFGNLLAGYERVKNYSHAIDYRGITSGMYLTLDDKKFYEELENTVNNYLIENPSKKLLLLHPDAMYLTYSEKDKRIEPFVFNFSGFTSGIYPEYLSEVERLLKNEKPLVLHELRYKNDVEGYEVLKIFEDKRLVILKPIE